MGGYRGHGSRFLEMLKDKRLNVQAAVREMFFGNVGQPLQQEWVSTGQVCPEKHLILLS